MNLEEIDQRAGDVLAVKIDPETAHARLDDLWQDVLDAIRAGRLMGDDAQRAAELALAPVGHIERWYS